MSWAIAAIVIVPWGLGLAGLSTWAGFLGFLAALAAIALLLRVIQCRTAAF
jgi:hypothetical protein